MGPGHQLPLRLDLPEPPLQELLQLPSVLGRAEHRLFDKLAIALAFLPHPAPNLTSPHLHERLTGERERIIRLDLPAT